MSEQTIDIDTTQAAPALTITDDRHLCDVVYEIASKQLVINAAQANQQAKIEAAKKAFADGTAEFTAEITRLFSSVEAYAQTHRDRLFPVKGKKRVKTYKVLSHKLQYRSSDSVEAPADAVRLIKQMIMASEITIMNLGAGDHATEIAEVIQGLESLIRQPDPELNKEVLQTLSDERVLDYLAMNGIKVVTHETFKLAFSFTPEEEVAK